MKAVIGVLPLYDDEKESYWMLPGYVQMLERQGAVPLLLPLTTDTAILDWFLESCNGFLLTGGHDISPGLYGEERAPHCGPCCAAKDRMEWYLLKRAVERDQSVLGICRGLQLMNVCFGGTLYQDLPTEHPSRVEHHMAPPYNRVAHNVRILENTVLSELLRAEQMGVNSYHHQAIKTLSPLLRGMAVAEDGLIEAVCMPDRRFVVGVQWHPEFSYEDDLNSVRLVKAFVDSMGSRSHKECSFL